MHLGELEKESLAKLSEIEENMNELNKKCDALEEKLRTLEEKVRKPKSGIPKCSACGPTFIGRCPHFAKLKLVNGKVIEAHKFSF